MRGWWRHAIAMNYRYLSNKEFIHTTDEAGGLAGVCVVTPCVVGEEVTERRNITVLPAVNSATTTCFSTDNTAAAERCRFVTEWWPFKQPPFSKTFEGPALSRSSTKLSDTLTPPASPGPAGAPPRTTNDTPNCAGTS